MGLQPEELHVVFFPFLAPGHMIPILDIAKLFAAKGVKTTVVTTPLNAPTFLKPLEKCKNIGPPIDLEIIPFPCEVENLGGISSPEMLVKFLTATQMLQQPLEQVLEKLRPHCLVADFLLPFANQAASKFNILRLVFHGTGSFALCGPYKLAASDDEEFVIPHLPHHVKFTRLQIPLDIRDHTLTISRQMLLRGVEAEEKSYGVIVNSFYELKPDYADHYRDVIGRKAWFIGPVSLCNQENEAKFQRGKESSIDEYDCLKWFDSKKPSSVMYTCFGTLSLFSDSQLYEIAMGLEASGQDFIWVVGRGKDEERGCEEWLPDGFEKRMEGKGLVIRDWAPQILILEHEAVGGFVTHCGWNSILEGVSCGVPMVTWPVYAEQFFNEKFVTEILKTGISIGVKQWSPMVVVGVKPENIKEAIERVMVGEEGMEMRNRAKKLKEKARKAIEQDGSSYTDLNSLIQNLGSYHK